MALSESEAQQLVREWAELVKKYTPYRSSDSDDRAYVGYPADELPREVQQSDKKRIADMYKIITNDPAGKRAHKNFVINEITQEISLCEKQGSWASKERLEELRKLLKYWEKQP